MGCFSKAALFLLNFIVFAIGVTVVVLASIMINKDNSYGKLLLSQGMFTVPVILLIVGLIIVIIGFLGCCGAMKENSCMLKTYAFIVLVLLLAEIVLGILLLVYSGKAEDTVKSGMDDVFMNYGKDDKELTKSLDLIQHELECCGVTNYTDWSSVFGRGKDVTIGCCIEKTDDCFEGMAEKPIEEARKYIYTQGCYQAIKSDLQGLTIGLGVACLILAVIQVLSITCACGIAKNTQQYA